MNSLLNRLEPFLWQLAQVEVSSPVSVFVRQLIAVILFSAVGILVLGVSFWLIVRFTPFSMRKELEEDQNTALAIVVGSIIIGMSIIIAAALIG